MTKILITNPGKATKIYAQQKLSFPPGKTVLVDKALVTGQLEKDLMSAKLHYGAAKPVPVAALVSPLAVVTAVEASEAPTEQILEEQEDSADVLAMLDLLDILATEE